MSTEIDHLRAFRAPDAAPDPAARAAARVALLERIAPAASLRRDRRSRSRLLVGSLGLAAAVAAAIALVAGLGAGGVQPATAAEALRAAAAVAARGPDVVLQPGQYWYSRSESRQLGADDGGTQVREDWVSLTGHARWVMQRPGEPDEEHSVSEGAVSYSFFPQPLTYEQVRAVPADVNGLYEAIERAGTVWASENGRPVADRTHEMFTIVGDWLRATPALPSARRAALYRVAARLPDVELLGAVRDGRGREGIAVAQTDDGLRRELVFDPDTAQLLMERTVHAGSDALVYESTYVESGIVDSTHERP